VRPDALVIRDGWLLGVRHLPSPNCNDRPAGTCIDLLVIHNISLPPGEFGGGSVEQLFCNTLDCSSHPWFAQLLGLRVSAHLLIDRHGEPTQFVPFHRRAWHAGVSRHGEREGCNDFSIGIELEGTDTLPYTDAQYACLVALTRTLLREYPGLRAERIVGHSDISPGRKTDPGEAFDWERYLRALA
jgi:AmpD protein